MKNIWQKMFLLIWNLSTFSIIYVVLYAFWYVVDPIEVKIAFSVFWMWIFSFISFIWYTLYDSMDKF